ncbi:MAG: hypothetical protein U5S82_01715 [Gammaproteobacteria bacterium]|nr:hypothetical protein [Gammaproteobacteria bacterium]
MSVPTYLLAGLFLPLFPLSLVFNAMLRRAPYPWLRMVLLLAWPQIGLMLVLAAAAPAPAWFIPWALLTSGLYALRALTLEDVGLWSGFLATSLWSLLWLVVAGDGWTLQAALHALGLSLPLVLLALLGAGLERRFGAARAGLPGGLAQSLPRYAGVLVLVVLAVTATPLFPPFFTMLALVFAAVPAVPLTALALAGIWLLWTWAGARLLAGLVVGPAGGGGAADLSLPAAWAYAAALAGLAGAGIYGGMALL